jgi:hypothetical protein
MAVRNARLPQSIWCPADSLAVRTAGGKYIGRLFIERAAVGDQHSADRENAQALGLPWEEPEQAVKEEVVGVASGGRLWVPVVLQVGTAVWDVHTCLFFACAGILPHIVSHVHSVC